MNIPLITALLVSLAALPFTAGVLVATWRQRRAVARRSRDLTIEIGPKVLLGVALTGVGATPVIAAQAPVSRSTAPAWLPVLDRGPVLASTPSAPSPSPSRPTRSQASATAEQKSPASRPVSQPANPAGGRTHIVRPGESLWSITVAHLGPHAAISDVAAAWPRLFELNRSVIGSNPRLVLPGQRLTLPTNFERAGS